MVGLRWAGTTESREHRVAISAAQGTAGSSVARELCVFLGTEADLTVEGVAISALRFGECPLVDGATIELHPGKPCSGPLFDEGPTRSESDRRVVPAHGDRRDREVARHMNGPRLTVVSGVACGTELVISRGSQFLESVNGSPELAPFAGSADATEIVMDQSGVHIKPGVVQLHEGDQLRCGDSWLRLTTPASDLADRRRISWPAPPTGDDSPAHVITVPNASGHGARAGLLLGLLPLVLGVVITIVTGMWFFMLFSALGAVVAVVSWSVGRAARARQRARVAAALELDLKRCGEAAPSAAEVVNRLRRLDSGVPLATATHGSEPAPGERWVCLGEAQRIAAVRVGDGPAVVPSEHRVAPVLLDLSRVHHLELAVPSQHRADVINAVAVQLLAGPSAIHQVILDPAVGWRAPLHPALRVVNFSQHRSVTGPAVEVYSAQTAATIPAVEDRVRIVVSVAGDAVGEGGAGAVLSWDSTAELNCAVQGAVPGLEPSAGKERMALRVDTVSSAVFDPAMQQWSRVQSAVPSLRAISGLPQTLGSHVVLPEASAIPDLWRATARLPRLEAAIGRSRHGVESLPLSDEHPHLLIAGTTGCGKSEVLRTLVAALACRYRPERLEFLFVDFKGGAALSPLANLPHRSTLLTDLAPEDVRRALEFLRAELRRRERLLADLGVSNFQRLLSTTTDSAPLAFRELVIVVDEVKMLVDAFSTAGDELAKIATVGRSLGIHLVLATQRPQGAIPADVRANVTQAVCLRVRTEQDSADVIGSAAAAGISSTTPGRAFVDAGHGAPVEIQTAILTNCAPPPSDEVRIRLPGGAPSLRPSGGPEHLSGSETGVQRVVAEIAAAYRHGDVLSPTSRLSTPDHSAVRPVPAPLPETVSPLGCERGGVDLGPAENSSEHWTGRATWRPQEDGTLFLIGQPLHTSRALLSIAEQFMSARSGPALYIIATTSGVEEPCRGWSEASLLHGTATAQDAPGIKALLACLTRGSHHFLSGSAADYDRPHETAVLMVEDWDRCCALLRAGPWAHLEDDLIALATSGSQNGVAVVLAGERSLSVGRASSVGRTRVYFPADQTPESLLQWPKLPAVRPLPLRGVLQGAAADRCSPVPGRRSQGAHTVIQVPAPSGDPVPTERALVGPASPSTSIWPRYRSLPERWSGTNERAPGLLIGLGAEHLPVSSDWGPGSTLLVVGPARSGRSTFLDSVEASLPPGAVLRCHPGSADELELLLSGADPDTTLIFDDADSLDIHVVQRLGTLWQPGVGTSGVVSRKDLRLIVALRLSDGLPALFPPVMQWRHAADTLLLRPRKIFDGDLFGASLSGMAVGGPPGRGYWIHRGVPELVQTPLRNG